MPTILQTPEAIAALVAAITSLVTILLTLCTKNAIEKKLLIYRLNAEYKFEQRKQIKNVLGKYKGRLLVACENLNYRLKNCHNEDHFDWLKVDGDFNNPGHYYFHSFAYRILSVYAWMHIIEEKLIHMDTTIASKEDLDLIKYMRFYCRIFSDLAFFKGLEYDHFFQHDHLFRNNLEELYQNVSLGDEVYSFNYYVEKLTKKPPEKLISFLELLDGTNPFEKRLRWNWFQILKLINISFLNAYGYDYQQTPDEKLKLEINKPQRSVAYQNFIQLLVEHKLEDQKEIKILIKLIKEDK